jgi:hypothetical protein
MQIHSTTFYLHNEQHIFDDRELTILHVHKG